MRTRWLLLLAIAASILALAMFSAGCGDDDEDGGNGAEPTATVSEGETPPGETPAEGATVNVNLTEFSVSPDPESAPAGSITFNASNIGGEDHELVVIRTDLAPDALPTADDGSVDEAGEGIEVIDEIEEFAPGGEESLTLDLEAGNYVLICNIVETEATGEVSSHYASGMTAAFEVAE